MMNYMYINPEWLKGQLVFLNGFLHLACRGV